MFYIKCQFDVLSILNFQHSGRCIFIGRVLDDICELVWALLLDVVCLM